MKQSSFFSLLLLVMATAFIFPPRTITGNVTDDAGNPIIAYVAIKGSGKGISTGANGSFRIEVKDYKTVLVISALGYETKEIVVGKNHILSIRLAVSRQALKEVVVVGYGKMRKKEMTGAMLYDNLTLLLGQSAGVHVGISKYKSYQTVSNQRYYDRQENYNREGYDRITENPFLKTGDNPLSTFSIDVDAASYSNVRRIINEGRMPPAGAVRIEEMINYFTYIYPQPVAEKPFSVNTEMSECPWNPEHQLVMIGLQGRRINTESLPAANLTFLVDVSGSMMEPNRLPLVKSSLKLLVEQLRPIDRVAMVVYAGNAGLVLPPTSGEDKTKIREAIDNLEAGGSTAGGAGIKLAYQTARQNFISEGNNRVILCTDGDFNVGASSDDELERMIEIERKSGVYLTVLGYGTGNYQDAKMQKLADKGNGNHAYIDGISEAKKVLCNEFGGTLFTIAKDVKLQIEFNAEKVQAYRLIGYENRVLAKEDFNNDKKDAGDMGSGHSVTALYELIPPGVRIAEPDSVQPSRYTTNLKARNTTQLVYAGELMHISLRYKKQDSDISQLMTVPVKYQLAKTNELSGNFGLATAVAEFGLLLTDSKYKGNASYLSAKTNAEKTLRTDKEGYRKELVQLIEKVSRLKKAAEIVRVEE